MTVTLLTLFSALTGLAALAGAAACISAQRGISLRAEGTPIETHHTPEEDETTNEL